MVSQEPLTPSHVDWIDPPPLDHNGLNAAREYFTVWKLPSSAAMPPRGQLGRAAPARLVFQSATSILLNFRCPPHSLSNVLTLALILILALSLILALALAHPGSGSPPGSDSPSRASL